MDNNEQPIGPPLPPIGSFRIGGVHLRCHAAAEYANTGELLFVSAVGPASAVKAARAILCGGSKNPGMEIGGMGVWFNRSLNRAAEGYKVKIVHLADHTYHLVAASRAEGLMTEFDEESLWQRLRGDTFTTPILRHWMPWLLRQLQENYCLGELNQANCSCGLLRLNPDMLDELVSRGVRDGYLKFEGETDGPPKN